MNNGNGRIGVAGNGSRNQNPLNYVNGQQPSTINHLAVGSKGMGNPNLVNYDTKSLDRV